MSGPIGPNDGGPAFPRTLPNVAVPPDEALQIIQRHAGMSLRDYFAAKAMQGMLGGEPGPHLGFRQVAHEAYAYADAMIEARGV